MLSFKLCCSPDILRKNVSIILNIELDDPKFSNLANHLQTIRDNWDLVSCFYKNVQIQDNCRKNILTVC